jgi:hypothetical protein
VFILFLGVIAALNQVGVATTVTTPVLIAILATVAGVIIVGAGGGLIKPMQHRWERYLLKAEEEAPKVKQEARNAPSVKEQALAAKDQAQDRYDRAGNGAAYDQTAATSAQSYPDDSVGAHRL